MHGALFTAWVLLFIVQTALISSRRVAVHRRLGVAGAVLAAAMVVAGASIAIVTAARGSAPPGMTAVAFLVIPLFDLVLFAGFVSAALVMRRNKEAHKRLMLLAYVSIITAAIARLPGVLPLGPPAFFGLSLLFVIAGVVYATPSRAARVRRAYLWGGAIIVISIPLRLAIATTGAWQAFAKLLIGFSVIPDSRQDQELSHRGGVRGVDEGEPRARDRNLAEDPQEGFGPSDGDDRAGARRRVCWGWIDGIRKSFDAQSFLQRYTPRRTRSIWSQINRDHVARLMTAGA